MKEPDSSWPDLLVVDAVLEQRLPDALHDAAVDLSFDDHRIDHRADIVHRDVAQQLHHAGIRIDLDLGDVRAGREREVHRIVERLLFEARLQHLERIVDRIVRHQRDVAEGLACDRCRRR